MSLNVIVVDDDALARLAMVRCIERVDELTLVQECENAASALNAIRKHEVDVIFLDVEMPEMTGIQFLQALREVVQVVIVSAKKNYAAEAFEHDVTDYIVKPVRFERFHQALAKVLRIKESLKLEKEDSEHIFVKVDTNYVKLELAEIQYVEALADYVRIHTGNSRYTVLSTMKAMEARLRPLNFARVHRSYLVNLANLKMVRESLVVIGDKEVPVSRGYRAELLERIGV